MCELEFNALQRRLGVVTVTAEGTQSSRAGLRGG